MREKWGSQWDASTMEYLLESGPNAVLVNALSKSGGKKCLVMGAGGETNLVREFSRDIVGVNISRKELNSIKDINNVDLILCDAQNLPLKDMSVGLIICKSTLHHLSKLNHSLSEMSRVALRGSNVILYEPGKLNLIAVIGRRFFPTEMHDPTEKPFLRCNLRNSLSMRFRIVDEKDFFLFAHAVPILGKKLKTLRNPQFVKAIFDIDSSLCRTVLRNLCWVMILTLRKD